MKRITANQFEKAYFGEGPLAFDIRKKSEFDSEHVIGAINVPLNELNQHLSQFPIDKPFVLYCEGGYRSMIAASILMQRGWEDFVDVADGFDEIKKTKVEKSDYICPTTML
ncbi:MAG: rhodanese-like domain-containing protein [Eudoraea sp.]|uniref:rhodanese-like domain-containing protein n=1 Tax=Eudoraea sp. TaxID=1979955 RepID=UPI003C78CB11